MSKMQTKMQTKVVKAAEGSTYYNDYWPFHSLEEKGEKGDALAKELARIAKSNAKLIKRMKASEQAEESKQPAVSSGRESLIDAVIAANLACPEQVTDAVLAAAEAGGMAAGLAELRRAVEMDAAESRVLGLDD